ncbi:acyl carrier protein phosphodiesterase [Enterovibrio norvegicus]|uniref:acyl carrier protein phosphodiesterase n=1 Tax=Enterovibrio norvegicus TaxID=188144 RepID=UPI0010BE9EEE|nr:ACP phosphodiesterase [Enterovibrio norvegicus]TKF31317.1 DUF479 domain-containing protein [Enterovibrio norvegicus]
MNYLAHLHVATQCESQLMGNLLADFVKGRPDNQFSPLTVEGIYLHRFVDSTIDALPEIKTCRQRFPSALYRYSAIALDVFWDHALIQHWDRFSAVSFAQFIKHAESECQRAVKNEPFPLPERFLTLSSRMWQEQWIPSYAHAETLQHVLSRMSTRSPRMAPLADTAPVLLKHYDAFIDAFPAIYEQVLDAAKKKG